MRRILVITHFFPWPVHKGCSQRVHQLLEHLRAKNHRADLLVAPQRPLSPSSVESAPPLVERLIVSPPVGEGGRSARLVQGVGNVIRATRIPILETLGRQTLHGAQRLRSRIRQLRRRFPRGPTILTNQAACRTPPGFRFTEPQKKHLRQLLDQTDYDTVLLEYAVVAPLLVGIPRHGRLWLLDTHDCFHRRAQSLRRQGFPVHPAHDFTREQEIEALRDFDVIIAIQDVERRAFQEMLPDKKVICVGMTYPLERLPCRGQHVTLVGSHSPLNAQGAVRVLDEVWPMISDKHPDAVFDLYGGVCELKNVRKAAQRFEKSVVLHGIIDDLEAAYHCDVVLAPLWAGSGLKTKVVEALCYGKPVITTPVGAQGLGEAVGSAMLVANRPDEIARHLSHLLSDKARRRALAEAAYTFAANHFGPQQVYAELDPLLDTPPKQTEEKQRHEQMVSDQTDRKAVA